MKLYKMLYKLLESSGLEWSLTAHSDGVIDGVVDDTDFMYEPEVSDPNQFLVEFTELVLKEMGE